MLTELCPHMVTLIETKYPKLFRFNCLKKDTDSVNTFRVVFLNALCSPIHFKKTGGWYTLKEELPKEVQAYCPMHYTLEEIQDKIEAFKKRIAEISKEK